MDSPPGSKKGTLKKAARKLPPTYSPSLAPERSDLKSTPPRPGTPTMVGATSGERMVSSSSGEGKTYLQPDDITEVTAESSGSSTRASTRAAVIKAANQAVQDSYFWSFSRVDKFSGPDCDGALNSFPPRLAKACYSYSHYFSKSKGGSNKASIHDICQRAFPGIFDLSSASSFNWRTAPRSDIHKFALDLFS